MFELYLCLECVGLCCGVVQRVFHPGRRVSGPPIKKDALPQCWEGVADGRPAFKQHWLNMSCLHHFIS